MSRSISSAEGEIRTLTLFRELGPKPYIPRSKFCLVGEVGLEPTRLAAHGPKPCAYTNSATRPSSKS